MGAIQDAAKVAYAKGPTGTPTNPDKDVIVDLFGTVEQQVTGAAAGMIRATTLVGLGAGTRVGQPGQVTAGPDKGEWLWNGSAWIRTGDLIDSAALEATDAEQQDDINAANARLDALDQGMPTDMYAGRNIVATITTADGTVIAQILDDGSAVSGKTVDQIIDPDTIGGLVDNAFSGAVVVETDGKVRVRGLYNSTGLPGFAHIVNYGQSNAGGADALPVVSGADQLLGAIKPIMGVQTWRDFIYSTTPAARGPGWLHPVDLFEANDGFSRGETYSTGIAGQLKAGGSGGRFSSSQKEHGSKIYFTNPTAGGRYLSEIIPAGTFGHYLTFLDDMTKAKAWATAMGMEYGLAGIAFCQGEAEGAAMKMSSGGAVLNFATLVSQWSAMLIALRAQMETDAKAIGAVVRNLPMFVAQTMAYGTGEAQATAAHSDPNIILCGPTYYAPTAINSTIVPAEDAGGRYHGDEIHHSADGQRWMGEMIGKAWRHVVELGRRWRPLEPIRVYRVSNTEIRVKYFVPRPPLIIDSAIMAPLFQKGFLLGLGTLDTPTTGCIVNSVAVSGDEVVLTLDASTPVAAAAAAYIKYGLNTYSVSTPAGATAVGTGAAYANGRASTTMTFAGDLSALFTPLLREGAFYLKATGVSLTIRDVTVVGGNTIFRGETAEVAGTPATGVIMELHRPAGGGNICDSDDTISVFNFEGTNSGRVGAPYPLNNFARIQASAIET